MSIVVTEYFDVSQKRKEEDVQQQADVTIMLTTKANLLLLPLITYSYKFAVNYWNLT
jgi:hypothetical protein